MERNQTTITVINHHRDHSWLFRQSRKKLAVLERFKRESMYELSAGLITWLVKCTQKRKIRYLFFDTLVKKTWSKCPRLFLDKMDYFWIFFVHCLSQFFLCDCCIWLIAKKAKPEISQVYSICRHFIFNSASLNDSSQKMAPNEMLVIWLAIQEDKLKSTKSL